MVLCVQVPPGPLHTSAVQASWSSQSWLALQQPATGAKVQVFQQDKMVGAALVASGEVTTDATGAFTYTTTAVRSRTIRFAYRTHIEDATFASTTDISLQVVAKISLGVSRHTLRNGQTVTFKGSVAGAPANARKVVELQVRKGAKWMTFRTTRLSKGRFNSKYRFTATRRTTTYVFRGRPQYAGRDQAALESTAGCEIGAGPGAFGWLRRLLGRSGG